MTDPSIYRQLADLEERLARLETAERAAFIGARYTTNAGQSIPNNAFTVVNFEDVDYDPFSLVTTGASWAFTCPVDGYYQIIAVVTWASTTTWAPAEDTQIDVYQNGSSAAILARRDGMPTGVALANSLSGGAVLSCAAGDTLDVRAYQNTGGALALLNSGLYNHVAISLAGQ